MSPYWSSCKIKFTKNHDDSILKISTVDTTFMKNVVFAKNNMHINKPVESLRYSDLKLKTQKCKFCNHPDCTLKYLQRN